MVSLIDGELTRTWTYVGRDNYMHVINLSHDTLTGVRHAMLDYEEIPGSLGSSSILMDKRGHRFNFTVDGRAGYLEIMRYGWTGFKYACVVDGAALAEATSQISEQQGEELYTVDISEYSFTSDWADGDICWYKVEVTRRSDGYSTFVHRRFRDFSELLTEIQRRLKGHHLYSSLPELPVKHLKILTDHNNSYFLDQRMSELKIFLLNLFRFPHVPHMTCSKAFLGLMEQVRETSFIFPQPVLGITIAPSTGAGSPAVVGSVQDTETCPGLCSGDVISKLNGRAAGALSHSQLVNSIKQLRRPIIIHFVQAFGDVARSPAPSATSSPSSGGFKRLEKGKPLPSFSGDRDVSAEAYKSSS